jgi:hypothetical protein
LWTFISSVLSIRLKCSPTHSKVVPDCLFLFCVVSQEINQAISEKNINFFKNHIIKSRWPNLHYQSDFLLWNGWWMAYLKWKSSCKGKRYEFIVGKVFYYQDRWSSWWSFEYWKENGMDFELNEISYTEFILSIDMARLRSILSKGCRASIIKKYLV